MERRLNVAALWDRAATGAFTERDAQAVAARLVEENTSEEAWELLSILGDAGLVSQHLKIHEHYRGLVERFLDRTEDPWLVRTALSVLAGKWYGASDYLDRVISFAQGVAWDEQGDVRLVAISFLGQHIRESGDMHLLSHLLRILDGEHESPIARESAYESIARAIGRPWEAIPMRARFDLLQHVDPVVVATARELAGLSS